MINCYILVISHFVAGVKSRRRRGDIGNADAVDQINVNNESNKANMCYRGYTMRLGLPPPGRWAQEGRGPAWSDWQGRQSHNSTALFATACAPGGSPCVWRASKSFPARRLRHLRKTMSRRGDSWRRAWASLPVRSRAAAGSYPVVSTHRTRIRNRFFCATSNGTNHFENRKVSNFQQVNKCVAVWGYWLSSSAVPRHPRGTMGHLPVYEWENNYYLK